MFKSILTVTLIILAMGYCNAQEIKVKKVFSGYKYTLNGAPMNMGKLLQKLEPNSKAYGFMRKAKSNKNFSYLLAATSGFILGWAISDGITDNDGSGLKDVNWGWVSAGVGFAAIAFPLYSNANKKALEAVRLYNLKVKYSSYTKPKAELKILARANGVGLSIKF